MYGKHNGLCSFKKKQPQLIQANCHAHVLHNADKHPACVLITDAETFVLCVYSYLFCESHNLRNFVGNDCITLLRHVLTRRVSLNCAFERCLR